MMQKYCVLMLAACLFGLVVGADTLQTVDGRFFEGTLVSQSTDEIVFEAIKFGASVRMKFEPKQVAKVSTGPTTASTQPTPKTATTRKTDRLWPAIPAKDLNGYAIIPLQGTFGQEIDAAIFNECLQMARLAGAKHIILAIDSPGGLVETAKIIASSILRATKEFTFHAWVLREGFSASIWVVFACDTIHVSPRAAIGAAVAFTNSPSGNAVVDDKFNSAIAAEIASIADIKGHPSALVKPMMQTGAEAYAWVTSDGKQRIENTKPRDQSIEFTTLANGKGIMTLTAVDCIRIGFAKPAANLAELQRSLGMPYWLRVSIHPELLTATYSAQLLAFNAAMTHIARSGIPASPLNLARQKESLLRTSLETVGKPPILLSANAIGEVNFAFAQQVITGQTQSAPYRIRQKFLAGKAGAGWSPDQREFFNTAEATAKAAAASWMECFNAELKAMTGK